MKASTRCRCRFCGRRRTLADHPWHYTRVPRCGCRLERRAFDKANRNGRPLPPTWRVDTYRNSGREQQATGTCRPDRSGCSGYSFPHAHGRGWCTFNPIHPDGERRAWS